MADIAVPADRAGKGDIVGAVKHQNAVIGDVALNRAGGAAVADLERSRPDLCPARIAILARQDQRAAIVLDQRAGAGQIRGDRRDLGAGSRAAADADGGAAVVPGERVRLAPHLAPPADSLPPRCSCPSPRSTTYTIVLEN